MFQKWFNFENKPLVHWNIDPDTKKKTKISPVVYPP